METAADQESATALLDKMVTCFKLCITHAFVLRTFITFHPYLAEWKTPWLFQE